MSESATEEHGINGEESSATSASITSEEIGNTNEGQIRTTDEPGFEERTEFPTCVDTKYRLTVSLEHNLPPSVCVATGGEDGAKSADSVVAILSKDEPNVNQIHPCHQSSSLPDKKQQTVASELTSFRSQTTQTLPGNDATTVRGEMENVEEIPTDHREASSSNESVCRICQLSRCETDEELVTTGCQCRGGLEKCHRSCLVEWALRRNSNRCEICQDRYAEIPSPGLGALDVNQRHLAAWCVDVQECARHRRPCLYFLCCVLFAIAGICGYMTARMQTLYRDVQGDMRTTSSELESTRFLFGFCLFMLSFCITLAVGVSAIWLAIEVTSYCRRYAARREVRRREMRRQLLRKGIITIEEFFRLDSEWRLRAILAQHPSAEVV
jgi:hypothetical protein